jgi:hypothetical protein
MGAAARQEASQNRAQGYSVPAPIGGLNIKDSLAAMPETDAIILDNFFCQPTWVELREGHTTLAKFTGNCETLMPYSGQSGNTSQLFAAINDTNGNHRSIVRVDDAAGGTINLATKTQVGWNGTVNTLQPLTSTQFDYLQMGTATTDVLICLNGADPPVTYDGTSWAASALTGGPTPLSSLRFGAVYKQRIWFVQNNTFNVYYLPQNVYQGALTTINLGWNFKLGGYLVAIITVSIDNTAGTNDYIAFLSNRGEVIMYQGYDPAAVATWSVAAHFRIGAPVGVGRQCWQKVGMDAIVICEDGFLLLSEAMLTDRSQTRNSVSDKIRYGVNQALQSYQTNPGWQIMLYPTGNKLLINVPTSSSYVTSYTYVMNTLNNAWSTWGLLSSPLNAFCWEVWNDPVLQETLFYGTAGSVEIADNGAVNDNGASILSTLQPAFSYMGKRETLKRWTQCQPIFTANGNLNLSVVLNIDYASIPAVGGVPVSTSTGALWNVAKWNVSTWTGIRTFTQWIGLSGVGYCAGLQLQINSLNVPARYQNTNFLFEEGGLFYGR